MKQGLHKPGCNCGGCYGSTKDANTREQSNETRVNVRFIHACEDHPPLMRVFLRAEVTTKKGIDWIIENGKLEKVKRSYQWLHWYWKPESEKGEPDCGFSGIREDHAQFKTIKSKLIQ